MGHTFMDP